MNRSDQRRIMREDAKRRNARNAADLEQFIAQHYPTAAPGLDPYHVSRGITGEASEGNRVHRASDNCWNRGMHGRAYGTAFDGDTPVLTATGAATVAVTVDGITTFVPASNFRRSTTRARSTRSTLTNAHTGITADDHIRLMQAMPAIGNVE